MKLQWLLLISSLLVASIHNVQPAKILGVFPTAARSHYIVGSALMKALAKKGHEVTVISPFPQKEPVQNYRDVTTTKVWSAVEPIVSNLLAMAKKGPIDSIKGVYDYGHRVANSTLNDPAVESFIQSNETFDLIVLEIFMNDAMIGFCHHFNAPCVGVSTFGASKWTTDLVGTPSPPSYIPNPFLGFSDRMTFKERVINTLTSGTDIIVEHFLDKPVQTELYMKAFPDPKPSLDQLKKTAVSIVLLNNHFSLNYPRPYVTGMIEVGGMHINRVPKPLPGDIQNFMDKATHGVIYFSMGSNIKSKDLPKEKRDAFLHVFSKLKQKVLWKWEDENLPDQPSNVLIKNWWPQDDILAHPNVKLFITHGGLLSTTEALYHGVPVIGIPVFGDQYLNMAKAELGGYGLAVAYDDISEERLSTAINKIINEKQFKINAEVISQRFRDQPINPLDLAVYWVEYVLHHKGAPHIRSAAMDLNAIQYHNLDVLGLLIGMPILILHLLVKCICRRKSSKAANKVNDRKKRN